MKTAHWSGLSIILALLLSAVIPGAAQSQVIDTPELILTTPNIGSSARYNADESRLLTWGQAGDPGALTLTAQVWDAATGDLVLTLTQPGMSSLGGVDARWNADESRILTRAGFSTTLWDARTGEPLHTFTHETALYGARLNRDESRLLTWAYRGLMRIWDTNTGEALLTLDHAPLESGDVEFNDAVWSPDESQLYTSTWYGLYVWDAATGELVAQYPSENLITEAVWEEAAERWAYVTNAGEVYVWSPANGEPALLKAASEQASDPYYQVHGITGWNHDGTRFYTAFRNDPLLEANVDVWDGQSGALLYTLRHDAEVKSVHWSPVEDRLLVMDGTAHLWDLASQEAESDGVMTAQGNLYRALWNDGGTMFVAINPFQHAGIHLFDAASGEETAAIDDDSDPILWNRDGTRLLTSAFGGTVKIWRVG